MSPNKTTYTKTVITEKEEKYEKKEIISYSGNKKALDNLKEKFDNFDKLESVKESSSSSTSYDNSTFTKKQKTSPSKSIPITKEIHEASEKPSSPVKTSFSPSKSPSKATSPLKYKSTTNSETKTSNNSEFSDWESGRKARLANLANRFKNYDDDEVRDAKRNFIKKYFLSKERGCMKTYLASYL